MICKRSQRYNPYHLIYLKPNLHEIWSIKHHRFSRINSINLPSLFRKFFPHSPSFNCISFTRVGWSSILSREKGSRDVNSFSSCLTRLLSILSNNLFNVFQTSFTQSIWLVWNQISLEMQVVMTLTLSIFFPLTMTFSCSS